MAAARRPPSSRSTSTCRITKRVWPTCSDGFLHVNPQGKEKGLAMFYNPLPQPIERHIRLPLYYTGLTNRAVIGWEDGHSDRIALARDYSVEVTVKISAHGRTWLTIGAP